MDYPELCAMYVQSDYVDLSPLAYSDAHSRRARAITMHNIVRSLCAQPIFLNMIRIGWKPKRLHMIFHVMILVGFSTANGNNVYILGGQLMGEYSHRVRS